MKLTAETLRKDGWRPIVSERQAWQLMRRELKHHRKWQHKRTWSDYDKILAIKPGNWFKFMKNKANRHTSILIWTRDGH